MDKAEYLFEKVAAVPGMASAKNLINKAIKAAKEVPQNAHELKTLLKLRPYTKKHTPELLRKADRQILHVAKKLAIGASAPTAAAVGTAAAAGLGAKSLMKKEAQSTAEELIAKQEAKELGNKRAVQGLSGIGLGLLAGSMLAPVLGPGAFMLGPIGGSLAVKSGIRRDQKMAEKKIIEQYYKDKAEQDRKLKANELLMQQMLINKLAK